MQEAKHELLSSADAAKILNLSADMVRRLAKGGQLPTAATSIRGMRLYRRTDVEELAALRAGQAVHRHSVQFYESDQFLSNVIAGFFAAGLRTGAPCIAVATAPHREGIRRQLEADGIDVGRRIAAGQILLLDGEETLSLFVIDGVPDDARFRATMGGLIERARANGSSKAPVRVYGEMVDLLWRSGQRDAAVRLEALWNALAEEQSFSLLCSYSLGGFPAGSDAAAFNEICRAHTHVSPAEALAPVEQIEAREREIAQLQQRARALEREIQEHIRTETALQRIEVELSQQNRKLGEALVAKDEFLAMVGHELRNPLAPILTALELLKVRGIESREHAVIERQVGHLVRLVDDLLDVSRLVGGKIELRPQLAGLRDVVLRGTELAEGVVKGRRADLDIHVPADLQVRVDCERMAQVVSNLLTNAFKYSDEGSKIVVSAHGRGEVIELRVRDQGVGIPADFIDRVFDPFVQQAQVVDRADGGLGLGLAIVRNIVELHGGSVAVRSDGEGKGSEFSVTLPAPMDDGQPGLADRDQAGRVAPLADARRVLIVDDNADAASLLAELLELLGHRIRVAHDGEAAIEAARSFDPEVALVDIALPDIDGFEVATRLRQGHAALRLVALSGYGDATNSSRASAAGFEAHLIKPVQVADLRKVIEP